MSNHSKHLAGRPEYWTARSKSRSDGGEPVSLPMRSPSLVIAARAAQEFSTGSNDMLRLAQVVGLTSLSRATIYRLIGSGQFPKPIRLSLGRVAWLKRDVVGWLSRR